MKTIIHVNQHIIRSNLKNKENQPVLTVKTHKSNTYAHTVEIQGPSRVIYSPNKPLSCGARVWIETQAEVTLDRPRVTDRHALINALEEQRALAGESRAAVRGARVEEGGARAEGHGPRE